MRMYGISDTMDTALGLKLAGVETVVAQEKAEVEAEIEKVLQNKNIGILIITEQIYKMAQSQFDAIKEQWKTPLLVRL